MNATVEQQKALLELQGLQTQLRQLAHRRKTLPEHTDLASLEKAGAALRDAQVAAETEVSDLTKAQAKAEADVAQVRARSERDKARLESGGAAKDLVGLQHEVETLARRQSELEDIELEVMERLEAATARQDAAQAQRRTHDDMVAQLEASRDQKVAELDEQARGLMAQRDTVASGIDDALLRFYTAAASSTGIGAAPLDGTRCGGCRLELSPVDLAGIRAAAPDDVVQCEECDCILIRSVD